MAESTIKAVEDTGWIYPLGTSGDNIKARYRKRNGVLYIIFASFSLPSTRSSAVVYTLREDCRPEIATNFIVRTSANECVNGWISAGNGNVNIQSSVVGKDVSVTFAYPLN